jgi:hypothetical protein
MAPACVASSAVEAELGQSVAEVNLSLRINERSNKAGAHPGEEGAGLRPPPESKLKKKDIL